jgi:hypothetical protein
MPIRKLCQVCLRAPQAVNYKIGDRVYYRSRCDACIRKQRKLPPAMPRWRKSGYTKKPHCEKCGFKAKYREQLFVYHMDGDLNHVAHTNLKTVCANCQYEIAREGLGWRQGDLIPDY